MKKTNKKGFTIVELVIVIAVIAILAGVLIPTFSNVVKKANESAALQAAKNAYTEDLALYDGNYSVTPSNPAPTGTFTFDNGAVKSYVFTNTSYTVIYSAAADTVSGKACVAGWNVFEN